jgi:uncharacterized membrane protein YcaP (DUF421 family)
MRRNVTANATAKGNKVVLDWVQILIRSLGAMTALFVFTRILGKKQISQLTFFEYIVGITLGELAGFISTNMESHYFLGLTALTVWFIVPLGVEWVTMKSKTLRNMFEGKSTVVIKEGKVLEDNLKKERFSTDELMQRLRTRNVYNLADVEFAVLETSGDLNVLLKKENQPLTPQHLGIKTGPEQPPQAVIMDGEIIDESLATMGLSRGWLHTELNKLGIPQNNVFLAQVDSYGELYIDVYDDMLKMPSPQNRAMLLATLKKCEADLEMFALSVNAQETKQMYGECAETMRRTIDELTPLLKR